MFTEHLLGTIYPMLNYLHASPNLLLTETQYGFTDEDTEAQLLNLKM